MNPVGLPMYGVPRMLLVVIIFGSEFVVLVLWENLLCD